MGGEGCTSERGNNNNNTKKNIRLRRPLDPRRAAPVASSQLTEENILRYKSNPTGVHATARSVVS